MRSHAAGGVHGAQASQQLAAGGQLQRRRRVQPPEAAAAGAAPRRQLHRQRGQVTCQDLWAGGLCQAAVGCLRPQAVAHAGRLPTYMYQSQAGHVSEPVEGYESGMSTLGVF